MADDTVNLVRTKSFGDDKQYENYLLGLEDTYKNIKRQKIKSDLIKFKADLEDSSEEKLKKISPNSLEYHLRELHGKELPLENKKGKFAGASSSIAVGVFILTSASAIFPPFTTILGAALVGVGAISVARSIFSKLKDKWKKEKEKRDQKDKLTEVEIQKSIVAYNNKLREIYKLRTNVKYNKILNLIKSKNQNLIFDVNGELDINIKNKSSIIKFCGKEGWEILEKLSKENKDVNLNKKAFISKLLIAKNDELNDLLSDDNLIKREDIGSTKFSFKNLLPWNWKFSFFKRNFKKLAFWNRNEVKNKFIQKISSHHNTSWFRRIGDVLKIFKTATSEVSDLAEKVSDEFTDVKDVPIVQNVVKTTHENVKNYIKEIADFENTLKDIEKLTGLAVGEIKSRWTQQEIDYFTNILNNKDINLGEDSIIKSDNIYYNFEKLKNLNVNKVKLLKSNEFNIQITKLNNLVKDFDFSSVSIKPNEIELVNEYLANNNIGDQRFFYNGDYDKLMDNLSKANEIKRLLLELDYSLKNAPESTLEEVDMDEVVNLFDLVEKKLKALEHIEKDINEKSKMLNESHLVAYCFLEEMFKDSEGNNTFKNGDIVIHPERIIDVINLVKDSKDPVKFLSMIFNKDFLDDLFARVNLGNPNTYLGENRQNLMNQLNICLDNFKSKNNSLLDLFKPYPPKIKFESEDDFYNTVFLKKQLRDRVKLSNEKNLSLVNMLKSNLTSSSKNILNGLKRNKNKSMQCDLLLGKLALNKEFKRNSQEVSEYSDLQDISRLDKLGFLDGYVEIKNNLSNSKGLNLNLPDIISNTHALLEATKMAKEFVVKVEGASVPEYLKEIKDDLLKLSENDDFKELLEIHKNMQSYEDALVELQKTIGPIENLANTLVNKYNVEGLSNEDVIKVLLSEDVEMLICLFKIESDDEKIKFAADLKESIIPLKKTIKNLDLNEFPELIASSIKDQDIGKKIDNIIKNIDTYHSKVSKKEQLDVELSESYESAEEEFESEPELKNESSFASLRDEFRGIVDDEALVQIRLLKSLMELYQRSQNQNRKDTIYKMITQKPIYKTLITCEQYRDLPFVKTLTEVLLQDDKLDLRESLYTKSMLHSVNPDSKTIKSPTSPRFSMPFKDKR